MCDVPLPVHDMPVRKWVLDDDMGRIPRMRWKATGETLKGAGGGKPLPSHAEHSCAEFVPRRHGIADDALLHSVRFRKVSTRYPRRVAEAYGGDLNRAMADTDEQVAATVAAWEMQYGLPARDWRAIGKEEQDVR
jgi:hypothetical protein